MLSYVCCNDGKIYVLNLGVLIDELRSVVRSNPNCLVDISSTPVPTFLGHQGPVECCTSNSDGSLLISCGTDGLRIWDSHSRQTIKHLSSLGDTLIGVSVFREFLNRKSKQLDDCTDRIPLPSSKAFQRTWSNALESPVIIRHSREPELQESIARCITGVDQLTVELNACDRMLNYADSIEADSLGQRVAALKNDRLRFNAAVCDMVNTVCQLPTLNHTSVLETDDDSTFYRCALPDTPIAPSSVSTSRCCPLVPTESRRLFRYVDRSFVRGFSRRDENGEMADNKSATPSQPDALEPEKSSDGDLESEEEVSPRSEEKLESRDVLSNGIESPQHSAQNEKEQRPPPPQLSTPTSKRRRLFSDCLLTPCIVEVKGKTPDSDSTREPSVEPSIDSSKIDDGIYTESSRSACDSHRYIRFPLSRRLSRMRRLNKAQIRCDSL